jgi:transcriptional regulator with XRE-family HTH domain
MTNPVFTDDYEVLIDILIETRRCARMSQRGLAARLGRSQSHINMIEHRQRRVEVREFYLLCKALGADPVAIFQRFTNELELRKAA